MNRRNTLKLFLAALASVVLAGKVSANGFRLPDQDAFATARGEAFVATADNASAIYYNPAGITQLHGNNVRVGVYGIYLDPSFSPPGSAPNAGNTYHSSDNLAAVPQLFYAYTPQKLPLSFGLGVYAPYGGSMSWPQDTGFRSIAIQGKLTYVTFNPVVALKVSPSLSIGGGVMVSYAKLSWEEGLKSSFLTPNFFRLTGDGWCVGYNLGLLWQPHEKISFGATFRSSAAFTLDGHTDSEFFPQVYPAQQVPAQADFTFPLTAVFGVSYRPTPKWNLEFDADYADWASFGSTTINQATKPSGLPQNIPVNLGWQASWMFELGVTRYFDNGWHASAGYVFNENSVPNNYYTPLAADMDRHFFSVGAGFKGERFDFDIAYQFGYGPTHTVSGSTSSTPTITGTSGQTADGNYSFISHAVMVTLGLHF